MATCTTCAGQGTITTSGHTVDCTACAGSGTVNAPADNPDDQNNGHH
ncbi:hypothetical protein ABT160_30110 [Streptomyces sp. NPDC001941]